MTPILLSSLIPTGLAGIAIWIILLAALAAIVFIAVRAMGVAIPGWVIQILWVVVIAVVAIVAIKFLLTAV